MASILGHPWPRYHVCIMHCLRTNHQIWSVEKKWGQNSFIHMIQTLFSAQELSVGVMFIIPIRRKRRYEFPVLAMMILSYCFGNVQRNMWGYKFTMNRYYIITGSTNVTLKENCITICCHTRDKSQLIFNSMQYFLRTRSMPSAWVV